MENSKLQILEKILNLNQLLKNNPDKYNCLYFSATWCGPCKKILPTVLELSNEHKEKMIFTKIDIDDYGDLQEECKVECLPTFLIYDKNGVQVDKIEGCNGSTLSMKCELLLN